MAITQDASAIEAKYAGGPGPLASDGQAKPTFSETGEMIVGTPIPEGQVVSQRMGRGQAPSMMVMPPGSTQAAPGSPQMAVMPPSGASRTTLGTFVDNPLVDLSTNSTNSTAPAVTNLNQMPPVAGTPVFTPPEPPREVRKPKLDLVKALTDHMADLGGYKSAECQQFYGRGDQSLKNYQKDPGSMPLECVLKFLANKPEVQIEIEDQLEPHFAANGREGWTQSLPTRGKTSVVVCAAILERPTLPFMWTLLYLTKKYELGIDVQSDTMIARSRNMLAHRFLQSGATWSLWLDGDIAAPIQNREWFKWITGSTQIPDAVANFDVLNRLLGHQKAMVGGVYASRKMHGALVIQPEIRPRSPEEKILANEVRRGSAQGLKEVGWVGFGCAIVHRNVFLEIQQHFPQLAPQAEFAPWRYFQVEGDEGEDEAFCTRVRACGIPIWLDTSLVCGHIGNMCFLPEHTAPNPL